MFGTAGRGREGRGREGRGAFFSEGTTQTGGGGRAGLPER